ncbi:hypothetical protein GO495_18955 [Chitinophaga oryziterrae]|uniref:Uncharacterized protein n=1 Tax=Chitinophaga oryziterrae TaxID=1031224 RepID=A0A6N8JBT6_9BACT|nr:hypothetical protein [Chitinophaga oryziterrae]MVT42680.1 hypothetical protein [Chitinophaga oryziterrae]
MKRLFLFIFTALVLASCGQAPSSGNAAANSDELVIKDTCAVIFVPSGDKLASLKSAFGEKSFPGILQFNSTTVTADSLFLASKGVKIIRTSATQLHFIRKNGESLYINLNHPKYAWEIFLFTGLGDPVKADLGDIETAYEEAGFK